LPFTQRIPRRTDGRALTRLGLPQSVATKSRIWPGSSTASTRRSQADPYPGRVSGGARPKRRAERPYATLKSRGQQVFRPATRPGLSDRAPSSLRRHGEAGHSAQSVRCGNAL
jgi:hypothetical protein